MDKNDGEVIGLIVLILGMVFVGVVILIGSYSFACYSNNNKQDVRCINGYLFTNTQHPVQILDTNKTPITCENK